MPRAAKATGSKPSVKKSVPVSKKTKLQSQKPNKTREKQVEKVEKNENKDPELFKKIKSDYRWRVLGQSAFITLSSIFFLGGLGWLIDSWIEGEGHAFLMTFIVISYPLTQFALYKKMKNFKISKKEK